MAESTTRAPWRDLIRRANTRTSGPTQDAIRWAMLRMGSERGRPVLVDTVVFAAVRIAERDREAFAREVEAIEAEEFDVPAQAAAPVIDGAAEPGS